MCSTNAGPPVAGAIRAFFRYPAFVPPADRNIQLFCPPPANRPAMFHWKGKGEQPLEMSGRRCFAARRGWQRATPAAHSWRTIFGHRHNVDKASTSDQISAAWGKTDKPSGASHHLAHHCSDVAAVFRCLLDSPLFGRAARRSAGGELTEPGKAALAALAFLHDIGKLAPAFQARGWQDGCWRHDTCDHISAAFQWPDEAGAHAETALWRYLALREAGRWISSACSWASSTR